MSRPATPTIGLITFPRHVFQALVSPRCESFLMISWITPFL